MEIIPDFTFALSYTEHPAPTKKHLERTSFVRLVTNLIEFRFRLEECYGFTSNMSMREFTMKDKRADNFHSTWVVPVDIDECATDYTSFMKTLSVKPTITYRTMSDGINGNRFRLIYVFDSPATTIEQYRARYYGIVATYGLECVNLDPSMSSGVQLVLGAKKDSVVDCSYNVFSDDDVIDAKAKGITLNATACAVTAFKESPKNHLNGEISDGFLDDLENLQFREFHAIWGTKYDYFDHSEVIYNDSGYAVLDNYLEIERCWSREKGILKVKDGHKRRNKLFKQCLIRRAIRPDITLEHLVFNLACERQWFFDNSDGQLRDDILIDIARSSMKTENIELKSNKRRPKFKVDKKYWNDKGLNANQAKQIIKKGMKYELIGKFYNPELTDKKNLEVLKEHGIRCCQKTLTTFKHEHGLTRHYSTKQQSSKQISS